MKKRTVKTRATVALVVGAMGLVGPQLGGCAMIPEEDLRGYTLQRKQTAEWVDENGVKRTDELIAGVNQKPKTEGFLDVAEGTGDILLGGAAVTAATAYAAGVPLVEGTNQTVKVVQKAGGGVPVIPPPH